jgi:DNA-binding response OmpR family regulator
VPVPLERKAYQVWVSLVHQADWLVTKRELLKAVWPEVYVNDSAVAHCLGAVRQLVTYRPGYVPPWLTTVGMLQLPLGPLSTADSQQIVEDV